MPRTWLLIAGIWLGLWAGALFLAAPAAFRVLADRSLAGSVVGAILTPVHGISAAAALGLGLAARRAGRKGVAALVFAAGITCLVNEGALHPAIARLRPLLHSAEADSVRARFGMLHGVSTALAVAGLALAAAGAIGAARERKA